MKEKYFYEIVANPRCTDDKNAFIVQEYERIRPGESVPKQVVFIGSFAECKDFSHSCNYQTISRA